MHTHQLGSTTVVLADDQPLMRSALRTVIDAEPDMTVADEVASGSELLAAVQRFDPQIVMVDHRLPDMTALDVMVRLKDSHPPHPA